MGIEILKHDTCAFLTVHDESNGNTRIIVQQSNEKPDGFSLLRQEAILSPENLIIFAKAINDQVDRVLTIKDMERERCIPK
jgi:hypothetical protein